MPGKKKKIRKKTVVIKAKGKKTVPKAAKAKAKSARPAVKKSAAPRKAVKQKPAKKPVAAKKALKPEKKIIKKAAAKKPLTKFTAPAARPVAPLSEEDRNLMLRRLLVRKREDIVREAHVEIAKYIRGENRQLVETALDDGDWSVIDLSEDVNLRKLDIHRQNLQRIDEALRKLRENTYGTCEDCGDEINAERLRILPFAIYCRDCQEKREQMEAAERVFTPPHS